jgi:hypothetical protein
LETSHRLASGTSPLALLTAKRSPNSQNATWFIPAGQFMLPYSQHPPATPAQRSGDKTVSILVSLQFLFPENLVGFGLGRMIRTTMPETAIDKHGKAIPIENKIGSTKQIWVAAPASYTIGTKNPEEPSFCCLSALAKNS